MPKRDMLINIVPGEECRIAIVEDGKLEELYHERTNSESHVGNIYKGRVTNVEPSIQAAFVDFGLERNGFLHITDLHPRYFPKGAKEETERVGFKTPHRERPPIQRCLKRGQEILVQVIKEGIGTKGPTLTSYLSIPGRFLVMMPNMERLGVSRKVEDDEERRAMKILLDELNPPDNFGFIIRTAGKGRPKTDLKRDLAYLTRLWKNLDKRMGEIRVGELYTESDLLIRTLRDVFSSDIERVIIDDMDGARRASDFLAVASPRSKSQVLYYDEPIPLYHRFGIEQQIDTIHARRVPLPSGGSLVIDSTEALVAVDVNSGKMRNHGDAETTAYKTNQEACDEICRQLRLRDLGGVVVIDLIDMRDSRRRRSIEARFRDNLKKDRARTKPLSISQFGILEMTRQRMRPSITKSVYNECVYCHGEGMTRNTNSVVQDVIRQLALIMHREEVAKVAVTVNPKVAFPLLNHKRAELVRMETKFDTPVQVRVNDEGPIDFVEVTAFDDRGNPLTIDPLAKLAKPSLQPVESLPVEDDLIDEEESVETGDESKPAESEAKADGAGDRVTEGEGAEGGEVRKRKRRRRRGRGKSGDARAETAATDAGDPAARTGDGDEAAPVAESVEFAETGEASEEEGEPGDAPVGEFAGAASGSEDGEGAAEGEGGKRKRRRRRRRRGKGGETATGSAGTASTTAGSSEKPNVSRGYVGQEESSPQPKAATPEPGNTVDDGGEANPTGTGETTAEGEVRRRKRRRRRRGRGNRGDAKQGADGDGSSTQEHNEAPVEDEGGDTSDSSAEANDEQAEGDGKKSGRSRRRRPQRKGPQSKTGENVESSQAEESSEEPQTAEA